MQPASLAPRENYRALIKHLTDCQQYLEWPADRLFEVKSDVSGWSIAYHLHHLAKAHGAIPRLIERLKSGRLGEENLTPKPAIRALVHKGIIPRGWPSPEMTTPPDDLTYEILQRDFGRMTKATQRLEPILDELADIPRSFPHIYFGPLNALEWLRFMHIHCGHHLGIIREIEAG